MRAASMHMTYHELKEALALGGCALCRLSARAVERYLRGLLHEFVNDAGVRERLRASGGFCPRHSWRLQRLGDPLGISILWRDLLRLPLTASGRRGSSACPACEVAEEAEKRYLEVLFEHLGAGGLREEYETSDGLCLPHLAEALPRSRGEARRFLLEAESRKLSGLAAELDEIVRKNDYRFREEPWGDEKDAWIRATRKLAGDSTEV